MTVTDLTSFVETDAKQGINRLHLMVDGMHCASCAWAIESALNAEPNVQARVNLSTKRLSVEWKGRKARGKALVTKTESLGYGFTPFDAGKQQAAEAAEENFLLKCILVSGFITANLMIFSLALWFSGHSGMGGNMRDVMNWAMALLSLPALVYAASPYYVSAWNALKRGHGNMDVPITLAVLLAAGMSLSETFRHGEYVYFDSSVMLLFFLLIGRYADRKARTAVQDLTLETAEQSQSRYMRLADHVAGFYTPSALLLAGATFLGWLAIGIAWQKALLIATTVLIITCPRALGLAVPAVQALANARLFRRDILLKSGDALERLASIDTVVFDKTGMLTLGKPQLANRKDIHDTYLQLAASLASHSKHPLSRAVAATWTGDILALDVKEEPGNGLFAVYKGNTVRLGRRSWCGNASAPPDEQLELWLAVNGRPPTRFVFADVLRPDAKPVVARLRKKGLNIILLSGDREPVVRSIAAALGITDFTACIMPIDKSNRIRALTAQGRHVLMIGDGLNDAPSLAAAQVSMSPSSAMDITQNAANIVFQGEKLSPVLEAYAVAKVSTRLVKQNFALAFLYNVLAVPLAVLGMVTPLVAAIAMSSSSLIVVANAMRLNRMRDV